MLLDKQIEGSYYLKLSLQSLVLTLAQDYPQYQLQDPPVVLQQQ